MRFATFRAGDRQLYGAVGDGGMIALSLSEISWPSVRVWPALLVTGVVASAGGFFVQTFAQKNLTAIQAATIIMLEPLFAVLFGTLLDGVLAPEFLGYLGVLPLALGLRLALAGPGSPSERAVAGSVPTVAILLIANSSDTIAAFAPLFAESSRSARMGLIAGFLATAAVWLTIMLAVSKRAESWFLGSGRARTVAHYFAATTMIVVGTYILWDTATDTI